MGLEERVVRNGGRAKGEEMRLQAQVGGTAHLRKGHCVKETLRKPLLETH